MTRENKALFGRGSSLQLIKGSAVVAVGRNLNALLRLVAIAIVLRGLGTEAFATYSVVLALLTVADWLLDYGTNDVFVREVSADPSELNRLWPNTFVLRIIVAPVAMALYLLAFWLLAPHDLMTVGLITAVSVPFFCAINTYRALFQATLTLEREMLAELVSVLFMLPVVWLVVVLDAGMVGLAWSIFIARAVFLLGCVLLSSSRPVQISGFSFAEVRDHLSTAWLIGTIGLVAAINNSLEILLLSAFSTPTDTALFAAAHKLMTPVLLAMTAIGIAFYPVISHAWSNDRDAFEQRLQQAFDTTLLLGGLAVSGFVAGAAFLLGLIAPDVIAATPALQIIMLACLFKAVAAVVGPVLYVVRAQRLAMSFFISAVALKAVLIALTVPRLGFMGAAWAVLLVEGCIVFPATMAALVYKTGYRFRWRKALLTLMAVAFAVVVSRLMEPHPFVGGVISGLIYCAVVFLSGATSISSIRGALRRG